MKKRIVSLLLVFCMVFTLLPADVLADEVKSRAETAAGQTQTTGTTAAKAGSPFADVKSGSWYEAAVLYARANGFFSGTSATTFEPDGTMTRAMFVTVLGRMAGVKAADYAGATDFSDVAEGTWYAPFVKWAARYGITTGTGNGRFSPDGKITREEMAVFFVRYFETFDAMPKADTAVTTKPADLDEVSSWAQDAVLKLWSLGMLNGDGKRFAPKDNATRAQTAALCERTDRAVETWYSEPCVKSERVSVEPSAQTPEEDKKPEEQKPSGGGSSGGSSGGGSAGGGTVTETYYEVKFEVGGVTMPASSVKAGTSISELPTPTKAGAIFLGWFYDAALTDGAQVGDTVTRNMTLYAKMAAGEEVHSIETPNYVTRANAPVGEFTFKITGVDSIAITGDRQTLRFINVTGGNVEVDYTVSDTTVTATLEAGQIYKVELLDSAAEFVLDGVKQGASVRILNILTDQLETTNAALTAEVKKNQIPVGDTDGLADAVFNGLYQIDENGVAAQNAENGTFTYNGSKTLAVGDVLAVTRGNVNLNDVTSTEGDVAYIKVTKVEEKRVSYEMADVEDVLFLPDVLPIESGWDMDGYADNASITVAEEHITAAMAGVDAGSLDEGDFLAFLESGVSYNANAADDGKIRAYGRIKTVTVDDATGQYVIAYTPATATDIENSLDVYYTQDREITLTEQEQAQIEDEIAVQVRESGYAEEAAVYLAAVMLESDDLNTVPDADAVARRMEAMEPVITATGVSVQADGKSVSVDFDPARIRASVSLNQSLKHLQGNGFGVSVYVPFEVTIGSIKIKVSAQFQEEVILRQSISTSRHKIGFLKYDYSLNASFVVGNYTGINFNAMVVTEDSDDDESMTKKLEEIMDQMKEYTETPEMSATDGTMDSLAKIYQDVMKNANDTWIDIVDIKLFENNGSAFLHIFCWQIKGSFVVSANLAVSIGMNFEYTTQKLYNFSVRVKAKTSTNETIDIIPPNYTFDFYVVGTIGIRAGLRLEMYVGLFSLKLDKIGITADVGAYAQLWGYFFYHLEWKQGAEKKSNSAGALYIEIGIYLEIHFVAQAFSSSKLTWAPTLYDNQWPLWSAGAQQNVYDFTCAADDPQLNKKIYTATSFPLSATIFDMKVMDMKTGDLSTQNYDSEENDGGGEENFVVTVSNPLFTYDPVSNTVTVDRSGEDLSVEESCDITFTWKSSPLAFTSKPISRTVHILWSDMANARFICFDANGGSGSETVTKLIGQSVTAPTVTRQGYTFAGWYTDRRCLSGTEYSVPDKMQKDESDPYRRGITVYAKWTPNPDTPYTVRHYKQKLDGNYELFETEGLTGTTLTKTAAQSKGYYGFRANGIRDLTILPDGSTVVDIYYARWSFKVTFSYGPEGGNQETTVYAKYGSTVALPALELVGYDFAGYQGLGEDTAGVPVTGDVTYTAQWTKRGDTAYRVEHYTRRLSGSGYLLTGDDPIVYGKGTTGGQLNISDLDWNHPGLELDHATVNGEAVANDGLAAIGADGKTVIRLYYERRNVTLTLDTRGGSFADGVTPSVTQKYGTALSALPTPTKEGCRFDGWYTDEACTTAFTAAAMPGENRILYAKWSARPYTITFKDGETVLATIGKDYGTEITAPKNPTKEGYTFAGWDQTIPATMPARDMTIQAKWTVNKYTITFKDGETVLKSSTQDYGTAITAPADPTREGYTFAGWDKSVPATMPAEDMVLSARWTVNRYTITFKDSDEVLSAVTQDYAAAVKAPADPTKEGYTFADWDTEIPATMPAKNMTIQAKWTVNKYTITFNTDGGNAIAPITQDYGTALTLPTPTKDGYGFGGWHTDQNCTKRFTANTMPAENTTLYAKWSIGEYTLTFDTDGGSVIAPISQKYGTEVTAPADPNREGYTFAGWDQTIPATMPAKDMTIQARWTVNKYTITFDTDGGNAIASITQDYGTAITKPANPVKAGYTFIGWDETIPETMPARDMTVKAQWTVDTNVKYTVEFYQQDVVGDGYTLVLSEERYGETNTKAELDRDKYDYTRFNEHFTVNRSAPGSQYSGTITGDGSLKLKVYYDRRVYTVTFEPGSTSATLGDSATKEYRYGQKLSDVAVKDPTYNGDWEFVGWYYDGAEFTGTVEGNMTVTAQWKDPKIQFTIAFYKMKLDGTYSTSTADNYWYNKTTTQSEMTIEELLGSAAEETGFEINCLRAGTYSKPEMNTIVPVDADGRFDTKDIANKTVCVFYERKKHTITWEFEGGTPVDDNYTVAGEYYYETPITKPTVTKEFYDFEKWSTNIWDFSTRPILHDYDACFTASWTGKTYKVMYNFNGGERTRGVTYPYDYQYQNFYPQIPDKATRSGYTFAGWKINGEGETRTGLRGQDLPGGDVTLVAQWTPNSYTVRFFVDDVQQGEALSVRCGEKIPIPAETPTKPHYTFSGWYYSSTKYTAESTMPDQDLDLKAKWTPNQHSVTYVTGCSTTIAPYTGKYGETYYTSTALYNAGKVFGGWRITSTDADWEPITVGARETFTMPDGDVTITAIWTNSEHSITYQDALWQSTGGYLEGSLKVPEWSNKADFPTTYTHGDTVTLPTPVAKGFTFDGWKMKSSDEPAASLTLNDSDACYGSTVKLIACWKQITSTITVDLDNGMEKRSVERDYGRSFPLRDILWLMYGYESTIIYPTRDYYTFAGWTVTYTKTGVTETYLKGANPFGFTVGDSDVEIKAIWTPITYTISFNPGTGGTLSDGGLTDGKLILTYPELVAVGGRITLPAAEKTGCQFIGWSRGSGQATPWTAITTEDFDIFFYGGATSVTLYANWIEGIQIHSEEDLAKLAKQVNSGLDQQGKTYILMNDISLSESWTAIGEISLDEQAKAFYGTFNGNGYTITLNGSQPVFGRVRGTVKDLKVAIGQSITVENVDYWGAVAAVLSHGTIKSCSVVRESGTTVVEVKNGTAIGGVVGWSNGRIEGCRAGDKDFFLYLQTSGTACVGGIVGINNGSGSIVLCNPEGSGESEMLYVRIYTTNNAGKEPNGVGGIVGYSSKNVTFWKANAITQLKVLIDTTGSDTGYVGGIIGNSSGATIDIEPGCPEINLQLRVDLIPTAQGDLIGNQPATTVSGITVERIS